MDYNDEEVSNNDKCGKGTINVIEYYQMNPFQRMNAYGIIPWKFIIHILLFVFTILQVVFVVNNKTKYYFAYEHLFNKLFLLNYNNSNNKINKYVYIYTPHELQTFIAKSVDMYYNVNELTTKTFEINAKPYLQMSSFGVNSNSNNNSNVHNVSIEMILNANENEIKRMFANMNHFLIQYTFISKKIYQWDVIQKYEFKHRSHLTVSLNIKHIQHTNNNNNNTTNIISSSITHNNSIIISLIVLILSLSSFIITWKHLITISSIYIHNKSSSSQPHTTHHHHHHHHQQKNMLSLSSLLSSLLSSSSYSSNSDIYYNPLFSTPPPPTHKHFPSKPHKHIAKYITWSFLCIIGNFLQLLSSLSTILPSSSSHLSASSQLLIGLGVLFSCINLMRYIEHNKQFSEMYDTLKHALPNVNRYLLGVGAYICGFIFFGVCFLWQSERFVNTSNTILNLFSLMTGDIIYNILTNITQLQGVKYYIGLTYGIVFCLGTIMIVLNIFIQIVDDSYVLIKLKNKSSFAYKRLKLLQQVEKSSISIRKDEGKRKGCLKRKYSRSMPKMSVVDGNSSPIRTKSVIKSKGRAALMSKKVLGLKNKEMNYCYSYGDDAYNINYNSNSNTFKSGVNSLGRSRKEMIEMSLSIPQFSIIEKEDERSLSSKESGDRSKSLRDDVDSNIEIENENENENESQKCITETQNKFNEIEQHFNNIKTYITEYITNETILNNHSLLFKKVSLLEKLSQQLKTNLMKSQ